MKVITTVLIVVLVISGLVEGCSKKKKDPQPGTVTPSPVYGGGPTMVEGNYGQWKLTGTENANGGGGFGRSIEFNVMAMNLQTKQNFACRFSGNPSGCTALNNNNGNRRRLFQQVLDRVGSNVLTYRMCGPRIVSDTQICGNQAVFSLAVN